MRDETVRAVNHLKVDIADLMENSEESESTGSNSQPLAGCASLDAWRYQRCMHIIRCMALPKVDAFCRTALDPAFCFRVFYFFCFRMLQILCAHMLRAKFA